jgi:hypothetical protein
MALEEMPMSSTSKMQTSCISVTILYKICNFKVFQQERSSCPSRGKKVTAHSYWTRETARSSRANRDVIEEGEGWSYI